MFLLQVWIRKEDLAHNNSYSIKQDKEKRKKKRLDAKKQN
jgi:hypothetical protein